MLLLFTRFAVHGLTRGMSVNGDPAVSWPRQPEDHAHSNE